VELSDLLQKLKALVAEVEAALGGESEEAPEIESEEPEDDGGKKAAMIAMMKKKHGV
jgi:hypothetical protein